MYIHANKTSNYENLKKVIDKASKEFNAALVELKFPDFLKIPKDEKWQETEEKKQENIQKIKTVACLTAYVNYMHSTTFLRRIDTEKITEKDEKHNTKSEFSRKE